MRPAPGVPIEHQPEGVILRMCLWAEARGEGALGQLAVLWVIYNRALKNNASMKHEVLRPLQFSSFNSNDPNRAKLMTAYSDDPAGWAAAEAVCVLFDSKATVDVTLGATHYYNPSVVQPKWGEGHPEWEHCITIGRHSFGKAA